MPGEKQRTLLALLALAAGDAVSADALVDELWPDAAPTDPANALQARVSAVRKVVGRDLVRSTAAGYVLTIEAEDVDACRFERLVDAGRRALDGGDSSVAAERLDEAIQLWAGDVALVDVPARRHVSSWRPNGSKTCSRMRTKHASTPTWRSAGTSAGDRAAGARGAASAAGAVPRAADAGVVPQRPAGRRSRRLPRRARRTFAEELGLDPGPALSALEDAILRHDVSLLPGPAARTTIRRPLTSFVGRAADLDGIEAALVRERLVTVVGPGGVGKTRLATEVALRADLPAWWVSLDAVVDGSGVRPAIAAAIGVREEQVDSWIGDRPMLLVLDNCEQVVGAAAAVVGDLLGQTSSLRILATSPRGPRDRR